MNAYIIKKLRVDRNDYMVIWSSLHHFINIQFRIPLSCYATEQPKFHYFTSYDWGLYKQRKRLPKFFARKRRKPILLSFQTSGCSFSSTQSIKISDLVNVKYLLHHFSSLFQLLYFWHIKKLLPGCCIKLRGWRISPIEPQNIFMVLVLFTCVISRGIFVTSARMEPKCVHLTSDERVFSWMQYNYWSCMSLVLH